MPAELALYRHAYPFRVRSFHVDRQNVVHNIWYFFFLEEARVEFIREVGLVMDADTFVSHSRFYVVRNTCDYVAPAVFDDELTIHSRIARVGSSSVGFEHVIVNAATGALVASATHVLVHVDVDSNRPTRIPDELRDKIRAYEGDGVQFGE
jgi:acyl-CoA thioester hydrolase